MPKRVNRKNIVVSRNKRADVEKRETDYLVSDRHRSKRDVKERENHYILSYSNMAFSKTMNSL